MQDEFKKYAEVHGSYSGGPVVLVSMTASSHGDVPRRMGFLLSRNWVNVALSRAKWLAVIVRSDSLTAFMPGSANGCLRWTFSFGWSHANLARSS